MDKVLTDLRLLAERAVEEQDATLPAVVWEAVYGATGDRGLADAIKSGVEAAGKPPVIEYMLRDVTQIPGKILLGCTRSQWPLTILYDEDQAARWIASSSGDDVRHVIRCELEPIEELTYVPPLPARVESVPVDIAQLMRSGQPWERASGSA